MALHDCSGDDPATDQDRRGSQLLVAPADDPDVCEVFARPTAPVDVAWLTVTFGESADAVVDRWRHRVGKLPAALGVVSVDDSTRGPAAPRGVHDVLDLADGFMTVVRDPSDLTQLGVRTSRCLKELNDGEHDELVLCFDSLTALLGSHEVQRVFRFLHVLTSRLRSVGARGHFHYDSSTADDRTTAILAGAVDQVRLREGDSGGTTGAAAWPGEWEPAVTASDSRDGRASE